MDFEYNDGGEALAGFDKMTSGGCFARAIAIANYLPYKRVRSMVQKACSGVEGSSAGMGVHPTICYEILGELGWKRKHMYRLDLDTLPYSTYSKKIIMLEFDRHISVMMYGKVNDVQNCESMRFRAIWVRNNT